MDYESYPLKVVEDIARLRRRIEASGIPGKQTDSNLLIGSWNIKAFGGLHPSWDENPGSPKRNLRAMAIIAEVIRRLDIVAIQEVRRETEALRRLVDDFLGVNWGLMMSDVSGGVKGNTERLAFVYDKRRALPSGLAGELVLPPTEEGDPVEQFDRTPYMVGFRAGDKRVALLTAHIRYGDIPEERLVEIQALADYVATEIRDRAEGEGSEEANLIVLGDFNIDAREDNPLFQAFVSTGLLVPEQLWGLKTTYGTEPKFYDQIAWFMGAFELDYNDRAGVVDFTEAVYPEISLRSASYRVSDHFPLWVEFNIDDSEAKMAETLGVDPAMPDPLSVVG